MNPDLETAAQSPYLELLGSEFESLPPNVQLAHTAPLLAKGTLEVTHGTCRFTRFLVRVMKLPPAGRNQPVELELTGKGQLMTWSRMIGGSPLRTAQSARNGLLVETSGIGSVCFRLGVSDGVLSYEQESMKCLGMKIPASLAPRASGRVADDPNGWFVSVEVTWRGQLICRYTGTMNPR